MARWFISYQWLRSDRDAWFKSDTVTDRSPMEWLADRKIEAYQAQERGICNYLKEYHIDCIYKIEK